MTKSKRCLLRIQVASSIAPMTLDFYVFDLESLWIVENGLRFLEGNAWFL